MCNCRKSCIFAPKHEGHTHLFSDTPDTVEVCPMPHVCPICGEPLSPAELEVAECRKVIEQSDVAGGDETGMHVGGRNHWMWTFQTAAVTYLAAYEGRGKAEIDDMFPGGLPRTILVTDRLKAYFNMNVKNHQICLAHLLRNTTFFEELLPESDWPKRMLALLRESIHRRKTQETDVGDEEKFKRRFDELIDESVSIDNEEYQKLFDTFRKGLAAHREHIFLFLSHHAVPYDNICERGIRKVKIKMKNSGTFRSDARANAFLDLLSIVETTKKHNNSPYAAIRTLF